jgi:hypothetical protein
VVRVVDVQQQFVVATVEEDEPCAGVEGLGVTDIRVTGPFAHMDLEVVVEVVVEELADTTGHFARELGAAQFWGNSPGQLETAMVHVEADSRESAVVQKALR